MRSDFSVWTHVACMCWFGADLCSMASNGCSRVLEPCHVVHISFAQRLSLSCGYSQAFCLWLVQRWDENHVFLFSAWLVPYLRCKWLPKSQLTTANFHFTEGVVGKLASKMCRNWWKNSIIIHDKMGSTLCKNWTKMSRRVVISQFCFQNYAKDAETS